MSRKPYRDVAGTVGRSVGRSADWESMYDSGEGRWDLGAASPPLVAALARDEAGPPGHALVPGCGYGHDVRLLATRGWSATGIDFARPAVREARRQAEATGTRGARFERRDLFRLPGSWDGTFDLVFEQTLFCAIDPARRDDYVEAVGRVLKPGGLLFGLFYNIRPEEGPPFGTTPDEVIHRFAGAGPFRLEHSRIPAESVTPRQGKEWLALLRKER